MIFIIRWFNILPLFFSERPLLGWILSWLKQGYSIKSESKLNKKVLVLIILFAPLLKNVNVSTSHKKSLRPLTQQDLKKKSIIEDFVINYKDANIMTTQIFHFIKVIDGHYYI